VSIIMGRREPMVQSNSGEILEFLEKSGAQLYTLLARLTLREDVAEDLMQELFIRLSNSEVFSKSDNRLAYAQRAAINLALNWRRSEKRRHPGLKQSQEPASAEFSPLSRLVEREELEQILDAVSKLRGYAGLAFVMRYIEQRSYEDIAGTLRKEPHQVRALCSKAMARLREMLGGRNGPTTEMGVCDA